MTKQMCMPTTTTQAWDFSQCNTTLYRRTADADISTAISVQMTVNVVQLCTYSRLCRRLVTENLPVWSGAAFRCTRVYHTGTCWQKNDALNWLPHQTINKAVSKSEMSMTTENKGINSCVDSYTNSCSVTPACQLYTGWGQLPLRLKA